MNRLPWGAAQQISRLFYAVYQSLPNCGIESFIRDKAIAILAILPLDRGITCLSIEQCIRTLKFLAGNGVVHTFERVLAFTHAVFKCMSFRVRIHNNSHAELIGCRVERIAIRQGLRQRQREGERSASASVVL